MITSISQLIAQVESNGGIGAVRFEPAYHPDPAAFPLAKRANGTLSFQTYETLLACSWGLYQIMGDNLYLLGMTSSLREYWNDPALQEVFFHRFCARRNIAYTLDEVLADETKRLDFAHHYNGNAQGYAARMMSVYQSVNGAALATASTAQQLKAS